MGRFYVSKTKSNSWADLTSAKPRVTHGPILRDFYSTQNRSQGMDAVHIYGKILRQLFLHYFLITN